jgi:hypothetical protein
VKNTVTVIILAAAPLLAISEASSETVYSVSQGRLIDMPSRQVDQYRGSYPMVSVPRDAQPGDRPFDRNNSDGNQAWANPEGRDRTELVYSLSQERLVERRSRDVDRYRKAYPMVLVPESARAGEDPFHNANGEPITPLAERSGHYVTIIPGPHSAR